MSQDKLDKTTEDSKQKDNQAPSMKALAFAALLVGGMAAPAGWFLGKQMREEASILADSKPNQPPAAPDDKKTGSDASNALMPLTPIVTNLRDPEDAWIRLEISLVVEKNKVVTDEQQAEISNDFIALLRQLTLMQIKGATGLMNLREDLLERARVRSEGKVSAVLISNLVTE